MFYCYEFLCFHKNFYLKLRISADGYPRIRIKDPKIRADTDGYGCKLNGRGHKISVSVHTPGCQTQITIKHPRTGLVKNRICLLNKCHMPNNQIYQWNQPCIPDNQNRPIQKKVTRLFPMVLKEVDWVDIFYSILSC